LVRPAATLVLRPAEGRRSYSALKKSNLVRQWPFLDRVIAELKALAVLDLELL
jgi:hypothetical protein